jgi:hypothetical protein
MKINPTVVLTFLLLAVMAAAGTASANWGLKIGREALKGVTQPDARPTNSLPGNSIGERSPGSVVFLKESEIIKRVEKQTQAEKNADSN